MTSAYGVIAVYKPPGILSNAIVTVIRQVLQRSLGEQVVTGGSGSPIRRKRIAVGHGGTLDPIAEGILVVGIGNATKLLPSFLLGSKVCATRVISVPAVVANRHVVLM
jgi:tRNA pseudouridine55 synthase